jgi:tetraacyldisaccharide 4'-kinase
MVIQMKKLPTDILHDDSRPGILNPLLFLLYLLSLLYKEGVRLRNLLYDCGIFKTRKVGCKVISIGNITVGGTGKTPMVIMLANLLKGHGYKPAVLSRGYGGKNRNSINVVSDGRRIFMEHDEAGDEPALIAGSLNDIPVITGRERYLTGKYAVDHMGADILILDDAFQHRSLYRDIDIVLLNDKRPFGNGFLLPRGTLREPAKALNRADVIVLTGSDREVEEIAIDRGLPPVPIFRGYHRPKDLVQGDTYPLEYLKGKTVCAFAGIADPESFKRTIISLGGEVVAFVRFSDHHRYTERDLKEIRRESLSHSAAITITTEKDGIKLTGFPDFLCDIFLLRIEMKIIDRDSEFEDIIMSRLPISRKDAKNNK